jgi:hypothetical protein
MIPEPRTLSVPEHDRGAAAVSAGEQPGGWRSMTLASARWHTRQNGTSLRVNMTQSI